MIKFWEKKNILENSASLKKERRRKLKKEKQASSAT